MRKVTAFGLTDVGLQRAHNEDCFAIAEELDFYVVCDGMGGHASGEVASRLCVDNAVNFIHKNITPDKADFPYKTEFDDFQCELLSNAVQYANDRVYIEGMKDPKLEGMGTTLCAVRALADQMVLAHVGDSRIYRWRPGGKLEQITRDHSLLNFKIDRGELTTPEEISNFKQGNVIVRAIGLKDQVEPEVQVLARRPGDIFLLCSDGLTDLVDDWSIENVLEANYDELDEACSCLVRMANDRGGKDNITVLLMRIDDEPQAGAAVYDREQDEITDPGLHEMTEDTQPRGIRAISDSDADREEAESDSEDELEGLRNTVDTLPRMRPVGYGRDQRTTHRMSAAAQDDDDYGEDDDWYSDNFEVDYRDEAEVDPLGGGEVTFGDMGRDDREEVLEETWRMTGGRTDVTTDPTLARVKGPPKGLTGLASTPTEKDPSFVEADEPVSFGKPKSRPPGRLAARRSKPPATAQMPSIAPAARIGGTGGRDGVDGLESTAPTMRRPAGAKPVIKSAKKPAAPVKPVMEEESSDELPSIIIDDSLLE